MVVATLLGVLLAASRPCGRAAAVDPAPSAPITKGQKIVMAAYSFSVFVGPVPNAQNPRAKRGPGPLAALAAERGKLGHETLQVQMIPGSTPLQHWNQGGGDDAKNLAKVALTRAGDQLDVFTLSPNALVPEAGIDKFGDFVIAHNPNARILVQMPWSSWDGHGSTPSVGGTGGGNFANDDRNQVNLATLEHWIAGRGDGLVDAGYMDRLRGQLAGIDRRAGREITFVIPAGQAVNLLRKEVVLSRVPGITKQSELFRDPIGHPAPVTANLVTYVWFATMYRETPVGLQALVDPADPLSGPREKLLQQIAWNATVGEPKSGVKGRPVALGN